MKTRPLFLAFTFGALVLTLTNCGGQKQDEHEHAATAEKEDEKTTPVSEPQFKVDATFQSQLSDFFTAYIKLKDAFVASDVEKVKAEASAADAALAKVDMKLLSGAAHNDWMTYLSPLQDALKEIQATTDLEAQRKSFRTLSDNFYKAVKAFGLGGKEAYYEYCPMAFNNEGAYWLSDQSKIRNPYFGDQMLTCGVVKETLK
ncbi:DUF3347 domain-containing protein [Pseudochryseolinea flava]|uniref:DUF3347 domain-containing protein n=1 Tax=Pseudochryseolinea flava TaxID=2059302 RepID=A0A364XZP9_9BACT|nr:DUF3347 domain-containing protein [Pseudochryseolinea flava]RAW00012.1 hypothetical protein DQQ10_15755 [Pseudochryseolinea flava]